MERSKETRELESYSNSAEFEFQKLKDNIKKITGIQDIENLADTVISKIKARELTLQDIQGIQKLLKHYKIQNPHLPKSDVVEKEWDRLYYFFQGHNVALTTID